MDIPLMFVSGEDTTARLIATIGVSDAIRYAGAAVYPNLLARLEQDPRDGVFCIFAGMNRGGSVRNDVAEAAREFHGNRPSVPPLVATEYGVNNWGPTTNPRAAITWIKLDVANRRLARPGKVRDPEDKIVPTFLAPIDPPFVRVAAFGIGGGPWGYTRALGGTLLRQP